MSGVNLLRAVEVEMLLEMGSQVETARYCPVLATFRQSVTLFPESQVLQIAER